MSASAIATLVDDLVAKNAVMVFSKTYCPYCQKAKATLANYAIQAAKYKVLELDERDDTDAIQDYLSKKTGGRSVPRVFIGGKFIGGGDDTAAKHSKGELKPLLEAAGAL